MSENQLYDIIVIGGGVSGLTAAYQAKKAGKSVLLLERLPQCGGVIQTIEATGHFFEQGPNSFAVNQKILSFLKELGLEDEIVFANAAAQKRYIFLENEPTLINPKTLLFSSKVISWKSKVKLLTERFKKQQLIPNETLADAIRRRLGNEILQRLINPVVSGIYAGDTEKMEYQSVLKKLFEFEQTYGSFTKGFLKTRKQTEKRQIINFKKGLNQLIGALSEALQAGIVQAEVLEIIDGSGIVQIRSDRQTYQAKKVVLSTPAHITSKLLQHQLGDLAIDISQIVYPSLLSVQISFDKSQVRKHLDAFGLLIPKQANKVTMGIINYSSVFNTSTDQHQYNLFVALPAKVSPEKVTQLVNQATNELKEIYDISGEPIFQHHKVWEAAIPQYHVGYAKLTQAINDFEAKNPQYALIGNWRKGVSIGECMDL